MEDYEEWVQADWDHHLAMTDDSEQTRREAIRRMTQLRRHHQRVLKEFDQTYGRAPAAPEQPPVRATLQTFASLDEVKAEHEDIKIHDDATPQELEVALHRTRSCVRQLHRDTGDRIRTLQDPASSDLRSSRPSLAAVRDPAPTSTGRVAATVQQPEVIIISSDDDDDKDDDSDDGSSHGEGSPIHRPLSLPRERVHIDDSHDDARPDGEFTRDEQRLAYRHVPRDRDPVLWNPEAAMTELDLHRLLQRSTTGIDLHGRELRSRHWRLVTRRGHEWDLATLIWQSRGITDLRGHPIRMTVQIESMMGDPRERTLPRRSNLEGEPSRVADEVRQVRRTRYADAMPTDIEVYRVWMIESGDLPLPRATIPGLTPTGIFQQVSVLFDSGGAISILGTEAKPLIDKKKVTLLRAPVRVTSFHGSVKELFYVTQVHLRLGSPDCKKELIFNAYVNPEFKGGLLVGNDVLRTQNITLRNSKGQTSVIFEDHSCTLWITGPMAGTWVQEELIPGKGEGGSC